MASTAVMAVLAVVGEVVQLLDLELQERVVQE